MMNIHDVSDYIVVKLTEDRQGLNVLNPAYSPNPARLAAIGGFAAQDVLYLGL